MSFAVRKTSEVGRTPPYIFVIQISLFSCDWPPKARPLNVLLSIARLFLEFTVTAPRISSTSESLPRFQWPSPSNWYQLVVTGEENHQLPTVISCRFRIPFPYLPYSSLIFPYYFCLSIYNVSRFPQVCTHGPIWLHNEGHVEPYRAWRFCSPTLRSWRTRGAVMSQDTTSLVDLRFFDG